MDKERKARLTQELEKAKAETVNVARNSNAFNRVATLCATLEYEVPEVYVGPVVDHTFADLNQKIAVLKEELRSTKAALTKATKATKKAPKKTTVKKNTKKKTTKKK